MDSVVKSIAALGIDKSEIKTLKFSVRPVYAQGENREERLVAYEVENILLIRARDLNLIGRVIDSALAAGADRLNGVQFVASGAAALKKELLKEAVRDGREKAAIVAESANRRLGPLLNADVGGDGAVLRAAKVSDETANFAGSQIFAGTITLTAGVNLVFALE
jgi:uncharacterized protein YggE